MDRRLFITTALVGGVALFASKGFSMGLFSSKTETNLEEFPYQLSDQAWKEKLDEPSYYVLRKHGTERSGSSPLDNEKRDGAFHCKGCDQALFSSGTKYDSGTGWPSFYQPIDDTAVGTAVDNTLFSTRTEVHCSNCGGHLGHVFEDGPAPTGLRYCMNGVSMVFIPTQE